MSKVQMPDPSLYVLFDEDGYPFEAYGADSDATEAAIDAAMDAGGIVTIERYITTDQAEAYADARMMGALEELKGLADRAYCLYIENLRTPECLGWEHKVKTGKFGDMELKAHTKAAEFLGRHMAFSEAADAIHALIPQENKS